MAQTLLLDLARRSVGVMRDGAIAPLADTRPPPAVDGLTLGVAAMDRPPPHAGERHLDGDELIYVLEGNPTLILEREHGDERIPLAPGAACVVPRGHWHRFEFAAPVKLLYATPGPNNERRPLKR